MGAVCARVTILKFPFGQNSKKGPQEISRRETSVWKKREYGKDHAKTSPLLVVKISVFGRAIAQVRKGVWPEERLQRVGLHQAHLRLQRGYLA
jgi:hypothetical protein